MSRNGAGVYSLPAGNPVVTATTITSSWANTTMTDIGTALTGSLAADGQTTVTANIPMNGFKITGIAVATTTGDALSYGRAATVTTLSATATTVTTLTTSGAAALGAGSTTIPQSPCRIRRVIAANSSPQTGLSPVGVSLYPNSKPQPSRKAQSLLTEV